MGADFEVNIESKKVQLLNDFKMKKANNKYLVTFSNNVMDIYNFRNKFDINLQSSIINDQIITNIDFNPKYPEIMLSSFSNGDIKLWNISESKMDANKEISIINAHNSSFIGSASFNPAYTNILISSDYKNIKLWDITKYFYSYNISNDGIINNLKWDTTGEYYGYTSDNNNIIIRKRETKEIINIIKGKIKNFIFKSNNEILTFYEDTLKKWDLRNTRKPLAEVETGYSDVIIYNNTFNHIYFIKYNDFEIFDTIHFKSIYTKKNIILYNCNPILLDDSFLKEKDIANIFDIKNGYSKIINVKMLNKNFRKVPIEKQKCENLENYIKNIVYKICDYSEIFKYEGNEITNIKNKNYFMIPDIKDELKKLKNDTIFQRKKYVEDEIKKNVIFSDKIKEYIYYIKLIIRDNTNKELVQRYLKFLKRNENEIKQKLGDIEEYKDELLFYKPCLSQKELEEIGENKNKSEKEDFIEFLKEFNNITDFKNVFNCIYNRYKSFDDISYFNQPIDLGNEELFYYKSKNIIYMKIANNNYLRDAIKFEEIKAIIKEILDKEYFYNNVIIKNEDRLALIVYLISEPEIYETNEYLLNLLSSDKCKEKEINEIEIKKGFKRELINNEYYLIKEKNPIINDVEYLCKNNFIQFLGKKDLIELYSFDYLLEKINKDLEINNIKNFLKIIFKSKLFSEIFYFFYGNEYLDFFSDELFVKEIVDNHIKFVPYKSIGSCAVTDRFSLNSYIFIEEKTISYSNNIDNQEDRQLISDALKIGRAIAIIFHEINHNLYSYILFFYNKINLSFESPRKSKVNDLKDGGFYMEITLFGRIIENLNLEEALYIMNEENYSKDIKTFQKDFINIKRTDISGIFTKFNKIKDIKNYEIIKKCSINAKNRTKTTSLKEININVPMRRNCVLGTTRNIDIKPINEFFLKYHCIK